MRSVNIYLKIFSMCKGCDFLGEVDGELGCRNRDGFFDFRTGSIVEGSRLGEQSCEVGKPGSPTRFIILRTPVQKE